MGREVKRVAMDFDWPLGKVWLPCLASLCTEDVESSLGISSESVSLETLCQHCRHAAHLAGVSILVHGCPKWKHEPKPGEGYQLWETVSEGSPISPVFATPEELADWLVVPGNDTSITNGTAREQWLKMIRGTGWSPSLVVDKGGVHPGTQA